MDIFRERAQIIGQATGDIRTLRVVRQDKRPPRRAPTRPIYARPTQVPVGAQKELEARYDRGEKRLIRRRTISIHLRFEMAVGLEFKQFVQSQGLTFSAIGNAIVKEFLTRRLREQQDALIEPVVRQEIRRSMGQQRRTAGLTYLQGRQNHHMLMSLLSRTKPQRAMDAQTFNAICDTTRDMARADVLAPTSPLDPLTKQELRDYLAPGHAAMDEVEGEGAP